MIAAAKALSARGRKGLFVGNDGGVSALINILPWSAGGDFLVNNQARVRYPPDGSRLREAARAERPRAFFWSARRRTGGPRTSFTQGLAAMQWGGIVVLSGDPPRPWATTSAAWPSPALDGGGRPATFLGGWSTMVNAQSEQVEEAKTLCEMVLGQQQGRPSGTSACPTGSTCPRAGQCCPAAAPLRAPVPAQAAKDLGAYGHFLPPIWNAAMGTALTDAVTNILQKGARPRRGGRRRNRMQSGNESRLGGIR